MDLGRYIYNIYANLLIYIDTLHIAYSESPISIPTLYPLSKYGNVLCSGFAHGTTM